MATEMASYSGTEASTPRLCGRMSHRANTPATSPQTYYQNNVYIPLLDHLISELETQFTGERTEFV